MSVHATSHPRSPAEPRHGLPLPGLDGANPLGLLAALGLFRMLDEGRGSGDLRLSWEPGGGTWIPVIYAMKGSKYDENTLIEELTARLVTSIDAHPANIIEEFDAASDDPKKRHALIKTVLTGNDRTRMDWISALASDFAPAGAINQLQTTRRDYFYGNIKSVISRTMPDHLRRAIFHPWDYSDALDNQSLHLDPSEDRRHAHQWNKPAGDPERKSRGGMLGANRLALEAFPLFPSFPDADTLRTVGFTGNRSTNTRWTWPIWNARLSLPVARSLLAAAFLQKEDSLEADDLALLKAQGVSAVFRTRRILVGKTPNFTPAQCIAMISDHAKARQGMSASEN